MHPSSLSRRLNLVFVSLLALLPSLIFATSNTWDGGGIDANWSSPANWAGDTNVPGVTNAFNNTDIATFQGPVGTWGTSDLNPIVIDSATQNIGSIIFSTSGSNLGDYVVGSTTGHSLYLTSGGTIQISNTANQLNITETINAPLIVKGTNAVYTFANKRASNGNTVALILNGSITAGDTGNAVFTFDGQFQQTMNYANGVISDGTADSVSLVHNGGPWTYAGNNTFTGSVTVNGTDQSRPFYTSATFTGTNATAGSVSLRDAQVSLGSSTVGTGGLAHASGYLLDNSIINLNNTAGNADRLADTSLLTLRHNAKFNLIGNGSADSTETMGGLLIEQGPAQITLSSAASRITTLSAASLTRNAGTTALIRGARLDQSNASDNVSRFILRDNGTSLGLVGSQTIDNAAFNDATQGLKIVPYLIGGNTDSGSGNNFVTYDATLGLRVLTNSQQTLMTSGYVTAANPDNVRAGADVTLTNADGITVNSLLFDSNSDSMLNSTNTNALTVQSGAVASVVNKTNAIGSGFSQLTLENGEGIVQVTQGTLAIDTPVDVTSSGGLVKAGTGTLILSQNNLYTGATTVNQGILQIGNGGGTGNLGASASPTVTVLTGATLAYNRSGSYEVGNVDGGGTVRNDLAGSTLILNQSSPGLMLAGLGGVSGSTVVFAGTGETTLGSSLMTAGQLVKVTSGTVILTSAMSMTSNIEITGGLLDSTISTFSMVSIAGPSTLTISGGELHVDGSVQGLNNSTAATDGTATNVMTVNQTGGLFSVTGNANARFHMGAKATRV